MEEYGRVHAEPSAAADRGRDVGFWDFIAPSRGPGCFYDAVSFVKGLLPRFSVNREPGSPAVPAEGNEAPWSPHEGGDPPGRMPTTPSAPMLLIRRGPKALPKWDAKESFADCPI